MKPLKNQTQNEIGIYNLELDRLRVRLGNALERNAQMEYRLIQAEIRKVEEKLKEQYELLDTL